MKLVVLIIVNAAALLFLVFAKEILRIRRRQHLEYSGNIESDKAHFEIKKTENPDEYRLIQVTEDGIEDNDIVIVTNKEQLQDLKDLLNKVII